MQALLSYDQSPPMAAPFRFFLTAPVFSALAGVLLLWEGPDMLVSRWTPAVLALTHLITVGFMMQVMLGAMVQILPVVAGANMARPLLISTVVHAALVIGTLFLVTAFLTFAPYWFFAAAVFLGAGTTAFVVIAVQALWGVPSISPTIGGLKLALVGLVVAVVLGVLMSISFGGSLDLPLLQLADIHLGWGVVAWGLVLLAAVAYVVVPMFQLTPNYPVWFGRYFLGSALAVVIVWSGAGFLLPASVELLAGTGVVVVTVLFALVTLDLQRRSKRARFDATQRFWQMAMLSVLSACMVWGAAMVLPVVGEWPGWPLLFGVLVLFGGFVSVMTGMLYKIAPFLIWLHLQNAGQGKVMAPNMKKIIEEAAMTRQMRAHFASCLLLFLAVFWPEWLVYPAGLALFGAQVWLGTNLIRAMKVYRAHLSRLQKLAHAQHHAEISA